MISADLKLLVDLAWHNRDGQRTFVVPSGFRAASYRLVKAGLAGRPPGTTNQLGITDRGEKMVVWLDDTVERLPIG